MNFLQIVQRARRKCRVVGTGPTTVISQGEEYARLVDWCNESWMEIQRRRPDWKWMRTAATWPTVDGQAEYTLAQIASTGTNFSNFAYWDLQTFRNYNTAAGINSEIRMDWDTYDNWKNTYQIGATRSAKSQPNIFAITPLLGVALGPVPLVGYTIEADYFKVPTEMALDADIPLLPTQFHMAIVYRTMMFYGASEANMAIYDSGKSDFTNMMRDIDAQQLPDMAVAGALA